MKRCLDFCVCVDTAVLRRQGLSAHRPGWPCVMQLRTRRRDTTTHTYVRDTYVRAFRISVIILNRLIAWSLHAGAAPSYTTLFFFLRCATHAFFCTVTRVTFRVTTTHRFFFVLQLCGTLHMHRRHKDRTVLWSIK